MGNKKTLLVIENDHDLDRALYVKAFMREYKGDIIEMTGFRSRTKEEIVKNVSKCTDIAVQTCFVNGSDQQFDEMIGLLAKMKNPINLYIYYINSREYGLYEYIVDNTTPEELISIEHHTIYAMSPDRSEYEVEDGVETEPHKRLDFTSITKKLHKKRTKKRVHDLYIDWYKETAINRKTGKKVLVLGCTAFGKAFTNLPIGEVVNELDCHELCCDGVSKGAWIQGNGEPIMLINNNGTREFKYVDKLSVEELLVEIGKTTRVDLGTLKRSEIKGLISVLKSDDEELKHPLGKANFICEELGIPKRGNRQQICNLISENLEVTK